ncbi:hypothetical protein AKUH4B507X_15100 [Apilactobacillus kunkeei]|nr:hypothetical protein AKUH3B109M_13950 [Apilactobacillus kunkeei]CAI2668327.1 hypothetical protein AKUH3B205J_14610 [Apilactobacillus kunkeei]CAI2668345.1 hypothetical protein AKUH3B102A_14850 [Apilactobacillus kunkeei]CAI2669439.1 hypothetical protein AKUH3B204J_14610 [Apilactobacillus kunkeei]CAI2669929.1 hypothetical protein AKUH3B203J_14780 [Apilactobacillus kunkeei]
MTKIDNFYSKSQQSKDNFYLGMISQVYRENAYVQVENLSLLSHRNIRLEMLVPNTINYFVVIDSIHGLFIAQVYQSKVNSSDSVHNSMNNGLKNMIYPELAINILGILDEDINKFKLSGFKTVGLTDKVYIANKYIISTFIDSMEINDYKDDKNNPQKPLKNLMKISDIDDKYISLKPNTLFDRHLMVIGTTSSGKSTSSLVILDRLIASNKKVLIIDPTGEYKDSFNSQEVTKLSLGENTSIKTDRLEIDFWTNFFNVSDSENSNQAYILAEAIKSLRYQKSINENIVLKKDGEKVNSILSKINNVTSKNFDLDLLPDQIRQECVKRKNKDEIFQTDGNIYNAMIWLNQKIEYLLQTPLITKFFKDSNNDLLEEIDKFINPVSKRSLYIDLSNISKTDKAGETIIELISNSLINNKDEKDESSFILFIDEVHRYINSYVDDSGLVSIAREGRKKGIFLFLTTQSPKDVPNILLGQIGTMIVHNLNSEDEIVAIKNKLDTNLVSKIKKLNRGEAILTSINLLQDIPIYFEISKRTHYNDTNLI